ncbi:hypothetical protein ACFX13_024401 [Malus domestica]
MGVGWNWRCTESFRREDVEGQIWGIRMESSEGAEGQISNSELDELLSPPYLCIPATLHQDYQHRQLQKEFE